MNALQIVELVACKITSIYIRAWKRVPIIWQLSH